MVEQFRNQSLNDQLKERKDKSLADGGLTNILIAEIKAILHTKITNILNQTPDSQDEMILLNGNPNDKGAHGIPNFESNQKKKVMSMPKDIEDDYQERFMQSSFEAANAIESELMQKIYELTHKITQFENQMMCMITQFENKKKCNNAQLEVQMKCKITQLEVLVKGNTHTLNRGFSQLSMLMGKLLQNHSNQSYCSELGNQNVVGYDPLHPKFL